MKKYNQTTKMTSLSLTKENVNKNGHREMFDAKFQSWGGFTLHLFGNEKVRQEFDKICFHFDGLYDFKGDDYNPFVKQYENSDYIIKIYREPEDFSLTAGYFGRDLEDVHICMKKFDKNSTEDEFFAEIRKSLDLFYDLHKINRNPEPILVIESVDHFKINGYYLWKF
jgi:hypothetical protein